MQTSFLVLLRPRELSYSSLQCKPKKSNRRALIGSLAIFQPQTHTQQSTLTGRGHFFAGSVYISGEDFEKDPLYVDTLGGLLAAIDAIEPHLREEKTQSSTKAMEIVFQENFLLKMVPQTLRQQLFLMVNR